MSALDAFRSREDLARYNDNALLLFALEIRFRIEDIHTVASIALTDSNNDKKCDLVYIDNDDGYAVIAQGYFARSEKVAAPANKASDLNTAVSWLINRATEDIPEVANLRSAATELRDAISNGKINNLQIWYVHNCPESINIQNELKTVEQTAYNSIKNRYSATEIEISAIEVGSNMLETWYSALTTPILVSDELEVLVPGGFEESGHDWSAFITSIPGTWIYELFQNYKSNLWSANIRGYLGSRASRTNINHNIKTTSGNSPKDFWVYNNGITAIVNDFYFDTEKKALRIKGISIVNGAQTTGAIGTLPKSPSSEVRISIRFIKCHNITTIQNIIRYNNTQNRVEAPDFRSNDSTQQRLIREFEGIPNASYLGGRRGGEDDAIKRNTRLLPSGTVAQALAAFYGDPGVAYDQKSDIWVIDTLYSKYFSDQTTAVHIVFVYSLLKAIQDLKYDLQHINKNDLTSSQKEQLEFLSLRGAIFIFTSAIAACLETFAAKAITTRTRASFGPISPENAARIWKPIVIISASFTSTLKPAVERGVNRNKATEVIQQFTQFINAIKLNNKATFEEFAKHLKYK